MFIKKDNVFTNSPKESYENELELQNLIFQYPNILIENNNDIYYSLGKEVTLSSGNRIDNLLVDSNGSIIVVEVKLSKNPSSQREVAAQILDYISEIKELSYFDFDELLYGELDKTVKIIEKNNKNNIRKNINDSLKNGKIKLIIAIDEANEVLLKIMQMIKDSIYKARLIIIEKYDNGNIINTIDVSDKNIRIQKTILERNFDKSSSKKESFDNKEFENVIQYWNENSIYKTYQRDNGKNYRRILINNWPINVHYEFIIRKNNFMGIEFHNEGEIAKVTENIKQFNDVKILEKSVFYKSTIGTHSRLKLSISLSNKVENICKYMDELIKLSINKITESIVTPSV